MTNQHTSRLPLHRCDCGRAYRGHGQECPRCRALRGHPRGRDGATPPVEDATWAACAGCGARKAPRAFPPGAGGGRWPRCWTCTGTGTNEDRARRRALREATP